MKNQKPRKTWLPWVYWGWYLKPHTGNDEWGRHTLCIPFGFALVIVPYAHCRCADMVEFRCRENRCPNLAMRPYALCIEHDYTIEWDQEPGWVS